MKLVELYYGMNVQSIAEKVGNFLRIYHDSLQALVQGHREVTMDTKGDFRFEKDGKTVNDKLEEFEDKLNQYSKGTTQKIKDKVNK